MIKAIIIYIVTIFSGEHKPIEWIVDVTMGYVERPLDLQTIIGSYRKPTVVHIYYRKFPIKDVPFHETEALTEWTFDRFVEKEALLDHFNKHGRFPVESEDTRSPGYIAEPKVLTFSTQWFLLIQSFYLLITAVEY